MKEINKEWLDEKKSKYNENKNLQILKRSLVKNSIDDSVIEYDHLKDTNFKFSIDIKTLPVANQERSGRCWIFAGLNVLREIIAKKFEIENFEFSQSYIAFYDKLEKVNYFLEKSVELRKKDMDDRTLVWLLENAIPDGGQWDMLTNIIEKYGLVSKDAMPETYQSSNTSRLNYLLNCLLKRFNANMRKLKTLKEINELKDETLKDAYNLLVTCYGMPPSKFDFEYVDNKKEYHVNKDIRPLDFYKNYVGDILKEYVSVINAPSKDKEFNKSYTVDYLNNVMGGKDIIYLNVSLDELKELTLKQLKDKELVWFGSDCSNYGDRQKGIWDSNLFNYSDSFGIEFKLNKGDGLENRYSLMNHAMVITGVNLDYNKPNRWKIENSWGKGIANEGYFVCSDAWFDDFVYQVVINKKYLSKQQLDVLKKKPIHLNPWDPMGTLAD